MGLCSKTNGENMDDEKISLRIKPEELQDMDSYLAEHPELGSRSLFIRTAVRSFMDRDAQEDAPKEQLSAGKNCISVPLTETQIAAIDSLVGVHFVSREAAIQMMIFEWFGAGKMAHMDAERAYQVATSTMTQ